MTGGGRPMDNFNPILPGTARRLGLRKPKPRPLGLITVNPLVPQAMWAEFVRQVNQAHNQLAMDLNGFIYKAANRWR